GARRPGRSSLKTWTAWPRRAREVATSAATTPLPPKVEKQTTPTRSGGAVMGTSSWLEILERGDERAGGGQALEHQRFERARTEAAGQRRPGVSALLRDAARDQRVANAGQPGQRRAVALGQLAGVARREPLERATDVSAGPLRRARQVAVARIERGGGGGDPVDGRRDLGGDARGELGGGGHVRRPRGGEARQEVRIGAGEVVRPEPQLAQSPAGVRIEAAKAGARDD